MPSRKVESVTASEKRVVDQVIVVGAYYRLGLTLWEVKRELSYAIGTVLQHQNQ